MSEWQQNTLDVTTRYEEIQILRSIGIKNIPRGWDTIRLERLLHDDRGISVGVMYPGEHDPAGIPLIRAGDLKGNQINPKPELRISLNKHQEYKRTELEGGELLLSLVGDIGRCAVVTSQMNGWNAARAIAVLRFKSSSDAAFVRLCLMSKPLQHLMQTWATTTVQATLNLKEIRQIPLPWPPAIERNEIASILGALDDKIELNRRMNETLEEMARVIFKDWFVDFGPTRAKQEGRDRYLSEHLWSLFPEAIDVETGLPEGWEEVTLNHHIQFNPSESLKKGAEAPYLGMNALPTQGSISEPPISREFTSGMRFRNGDTLFARITPCLENGKTAFVQNLASNEIGWGSTEFIVMRSIPPVPKVFSYLVARDQSFRATAIQSMTGTSGRQRARTEALENYIFCKPQNRVWEYLDSILDPMFDKVTAHDLESRTLAEMRDRLLPKLMSGEIRVKNAEKLVEDAV